MTLITEYDHSTNGTAPLVSAGPRIPRREAWMDLPEEYAGFRFRGWSNFPSRLGSEIRSGDQERIRAALLQIVLEHNGWCDSDGTPLPPAHDPAFWDAVPDELAIAVITLLTVDVGKLGASIRKRSAS
jgi:hypothetical protein